MSVMRAPTAATLTALLLLAACQTSQSAHRAPAAFEPVPKPVGDEIVICGKRVHTGAPVVLWKEAPHYDAYATRPRFKAELAGGEDPKDIGLRYEPGRVEKRTHPNPAFVPKPPGDVEDTRTSEQKSATIVDPSVVRVDPDCEDPKTLADVVDQFVLHFDVCGISRTCFRVLQDERHLSVHFMLDIDGTIYQTLDLRETAWHATKSNWRSVGVEIANMGAYPPNAASVLDDWYAHDAGGPYIQIPKRVADSGVRTPGFVGRPARSELVRGRIQGDELVQYDFTPEQYASLVKLAAVLCRELPRIRPDAPRDESGHVRDAALSDEKWRQFQGILGHFYVQTNKNDPGPAFDWDRFLAAVRARMAENEMAGP